MAQEGKKKKWNRSDLSNRIETMELFRSNIEN